jgi:hypothetical protein
MTVLQEVRKMFFFEKKNQKTLVCWVPRQVIDEAPGGTSAGAKAFCFFFQKRSPAFLPRMVREWQTSTP